MEEGKTIIIKRLLVVLYCLVIVLAAWQIIPAFNTYKSTGVLEVNASTSSAQLSISQENHQAAIIGTGSAKVRLLPGTYQVAAIDSGSRASAVVTVYKGRTTHSSLNVSGNNSANSTNNNNTPQVRTAEDINFEGTDALINDGLTTDQVNEMEQYFFQFKSSANTVTIDQNTVGPGPHNPNVVSPFTLNFNVAIDSTSYKATISYTDLNNVTLQLFNPQTGAVVYDSSKPAGAGQ